MASVARSIRFPNVLLVTGPDLISGDYRDNLVNLLEAVGGASPVGAGTHDFWATFRVGSAATPNHDKMDASRRPRIRRGILELASPPTATDVATLAPRLFTLVHEIGHGWLVPRDLTVRDPSYWPGPDRSGPGMDGYDASIAFTEVSRFWGPALIARQGRHWSVWAHSGGAGMDDVP